MSTRRQTSKITLLLGGVALAAAACGSGGNAASSGSAADSSPTGASNGALVSRASVDGTSILAGADGHTLYSASGESANHILCVDSCTSFWKPVMASQQQAQQASSTLGQSFTVVSRPDGGMQLAYAGHPLYTFTQEGAHQLRGNGFTDKFQGTSFTWSAAGTGGSAGAQPSAGCCDV
jgi:predicted lipoprotein with Yx(FWY)xxD motif